MSNLKLCLSCNGEGVIIESPEGTTCQSYIECSDCNGEGEKKYEQS